MKDNDYDLTSFPRYQFSEFVGGTREGGQWVVRSNDLNDFKTALNDMGAIFDKKTPATSAKVTTTPPSMCPMHGVAMESAISAKTNKAYWSHRNEDNAICFGKGYK